MTTQNKKMYKLVHPGRLFEKRGILYFELNTKRKSLGLKLADSASENKALIITARKMCENLWKYAETANGNFPAKEIQRDLYSTFTEFLDYKHLRIGMKTIKGHITALRKIAPDNVLLKESSLKTIITKFINDKTIGSVSKNTYMRHFQVFAAWCKRQGYLSDTNYYTEYKLPAKGQKREPYTQEEIMLILSQAVKGDLEFYLLLRFLIYSGRRIKETLNLTWDRVMEEQGYIILNNKINTDENDFFPISTKLKEVLEYLKPIAASRLTEAKRNKVFRWEGSTVPRLSRRLTEIQEEITKDDGTVVNLKHHNRGFHGFRRSYATILYQNVDKTQDIADLMGHRDMNLTREIYAAKNMPALTEVINRLQKDM